MKVSRKAVSQTLNMPLIIKSQCMVMKSKMTVMKRNEMKRIMGMPVSS
jgi:hypothetical protein